MNTENNETLRLRLFEDNGENLYLVAWRGMTCELLCHYSPAYHSAEDVARDLRGLHSGELKPADFEEGEWVAEWLENCTTPEERAAARKAAFEGLRGLARVWTDGRWVDWGDLADWTREVRLWYTANPQELPTVDLCVEYAETVQCREGCSVEQTHDETIDLLYRAVKDMVWSLDRVEENMDTLGRIARRGVSFAWSPGFGAVFQDADGEECAPEKAVRLYIDCERISMRGEQGERENDGSDMLHFIANCIAAANKWGLECDYDRDGDSESLTLNLEADLTFGQRYDLATERIADAVLELLGHWRVKEEFESVQGAHITLDGLKADWCWELTEGRSILSGDRIFEQLGERPCAWSRCDYVDWVRNILPPDELGRFWGEA